MADRLIVEIARERLERAALAFHNALITKNAGTIAVMARELGDAADAFGNARDEEKTRILDAMSKLQETKR